MIFLGQNAFWLFIQRKIVKEVAKCKPCTEIGKIPKQVIPASKWKSHKNCSEPNEESQTELQMKKFKMYNFMHVSAATLNTQH